MQAQIASSVTIDRSLQAFIIGWVFASFLQGVGGFGVPVAVTSPLLISLGFSPLSAVVIPSLGHGWAVTFGSMGSSFQASLTTSGLPAEVLAPPAALFLGLACPAIGLAIAHSIGTGWAEMRRLMVPILTWGTIMACVQYLVVVSGLWNLGSFIGGLAGLLITTILVGRFSRKLTTQYNGVKLWSPNPGPNSRQLIVALSGYLILITITLSIQLIPALREFFGQVNFQIYFPKITSASGLITPAGAGRRINLFGHTGSLLIYSAILAFLFYESLHQYAPALHQPRSVAKTF